MHEPLTIGRNIDRLVGLWPNAGFSTDWIDLFRREFEHSNQDWLVEAMETVKRTKASHVPELKWFIEEFREIGRRLAAMQAAKPTSREEKAKAKAEESERERLEVESERRNIRRHMADIHPESLERIRDTMRRSDFLRCLADSLAKPIEDWSAIALGQAHAIAVRDGLLNTHAATFATSIDFEGDDR